MNSIQASQIMGGNGAKARKAADLYPTPPEVTVALMRFLKLPAGTDIWEPARGQGDMVRALADCGMAVYGADGRAITLPCKLGGEVWAPGCGRTVKLRVVEAALLLQGEDGEGYEKLSDFGKTFFAAKEGAEEAKRNEWFT